MKPCFKWSGKQWEIENFPDTGVFSGWGPGMVLIGAKEKKICYIFGRGSIFDLYMRRVDQRGLEMITERYLKDLYIPIDFLDIEKKL